MLRIVIILGCVVSLASAAKAQVNAGDLKWGPAPPNLPPGSEMAVLAGDPTKPGVFVARAKVPPGYKVPPHHHPTDEYVTVLSGDLTYGMGDKFDTTKGHAMTAGGFFQAAANMNHYVWSKSGAVIQFSAEGPFAIIYVNPADDPTKR